MRLVARSKLVLVGAAAAVATGLGGCGDNGPSKTEYIEKADALCARDDVKVDAALAFAAEDDPRPKEAQAALQEILPLMRKQVTERRALEAPDGDQDEIDRVNEGMARGVDRLEAASRDPDSSLDFILGESGDDAFLPPLRLAGAYGMVNCEAAIPTRSGQT